jgi:hypothetical protein
MIIIRCLEDEYRNTFIIATIPNSGSLIAAVPAVEGEVKSLDEKHQLQIDSTRRLIIFIFAGAIIFTKYFLHTLMA